MFEPSGSILSHCNAGCHPWKNCGNNGVGGCLDQAEGLTLKEEPYTMRVPRSQRGGEVVEPLVREQWFVRMQPLAEPALEVGCLTWQCRTHVIAFGSKWFNPSVGQFAGFSVAYER